MDKEDQDFTLNEIFKFAGKTIFFLGNSGTGTFLPVYQ